MFFDKGSGYNIFQYTEQLTLVNSRVLIVDCCFRKLFSLMIYQMFNASHRSSYKEGCGKKLIELLE